MSDDDFRSFYFLMSSQREKTQHGVQSVVFCLEMYECHFVPWVTVSLDEWHCSVTRPAPLVYWLEALVLVARRVFVEVRLVRLAALTPSWHFGESDSPTSLF